MKVKRFQAPTLREALLMVHEDLGSGAMVLTTRQVTKGGVMGLLGSQEIEVTASVDDQPVPPKAPPPEEPTGILDRAAQARDQLILGGSTRSVSAGAPAAAGKVHSSTWQAVLKSARSRAVATPAEPSTRAGSQGFAAVRSRASPKAPVFAAGSPGLAGGDQAKPGVTASDEIRLLERQIRELEAALLDVARCADPDIAPGLPTPLARMQRRLLDESVPREVARDVVRTVHRSDRAAVPSAGLPETQWKGDVVEDARVRVVHELSQRMACKGAIRVRRQLVKSPPAETPDAALPPAHRPMTVALCGPTGVGKTTTIAKLAANFKVRDKVDVALITIDTYRIGAVEQLRIYAEILGVPLAAVHTPEEYRQALEHYADRDLVLIDTSGRGQRDRTRLSGLGDFFKAVPPDEIHLVLSLTTENGTLRQMIERFGALGADHLIFTKLDEAVHYGGAMCACQAAALPVSYVTTGQEVPDDIAVAEAVSLARLVMKEPQGYGLRDVVASGLISTRNSA